MNGTFGTPAPLPGQPGFRAAPSEAMARETADMEERLARLRNDLAVEAELREATESKQGGFRWRSARTDRGSVRAYAKDVKHRHRRQLEKRSPRGMPTGRVASMQGKPQAGGGARAAAALREEHRKLHQHPQGTQCEGETTFEVPDEKTSRDRYACKDVAQWSVGDTLEWLRRLGLGQHQQVFQMNEISGGILLEVGPDDLDYMGVRILAHRKRLLKGIEELRAHARTDPRAQPPALTFQAEAQEHETERSTRDHRGKRTPAPDQARGSSGRATEPPLCRESGPISDKSSEAIVQMTPGGPSSTTSEHAGPPVPDNAGHHFVSSRDRPSRQLPIRWGDSAPARAPISSAPSEDSPLAREHHAGGRERQDPRPIGLLGTTPAVECWTNPFARDRPGARDEDDSPRETGSPPSATPTIKAEAGVSTTGDGRGTSDEEEAEHAAFRRAVEEWNRAGSGPGTSGRGDEDGGWRHHGASGGEATGVTPDPAASRRQATELKAAALREQMDEDHRLQSRRFEETRRQLLQGLHAGWREHHGGHGSSGLGMGGCAAGEWDIGTASGASCTPDYDGGSGCNDSACLSASTKSDDDECFSNDESQGPSPRWGPRRDTDGGGDVEIELVGSVIGTGLPSQRCMPSCVVEDDASSEEGPRP